VEIEKWRIYMADLNPGMGGYQAIDVLERLSGGRPVERQLMLTALASADLWAQNADFLRTLGQVLGVS